MSITYRTEIGGLGSGMSGSATVTPYVTNAGATPSTTLPGSITATVGTVWEDPAEPGRYGCPVTLSAPLPTGYELRLGWSVGGVAITDVDPACVGGILDTIVGTGGQNMRQKLELIQSTTVNKLNGLPSGPIHFRDADDAADLVVTAFDGSDNRTSVTQTPPA